MGSSLRESRQLTVDSSQFLKVVSFQLSVFSRSGSGLVRGGSANQYSVLSTQYRVPGTGCQVPGTPTPNRVRTNNLTTPTNFLYINKLQNNSSTIPHPQGPRNVPPSLRLLAPSPLRPSALRSPLSALRSPLSALRFPLPSLPRPRPLGLQSIPRRWSRQLSVSLR